MRYLIPILFVFVPAFASKEQVPLRNIPEDEKNLLFELVKRLRKGSDLGESRWEDKARCDVSTNMNSIIKKIDSVNNGAKFLTLHKDTETNEACFDLCCKNESCDLAVYENKAGHYCYLFQCEGKCRFGHHSSYISNTIISRPQPSSQAVNGPELDLINLDQELDSTDNDKEDSFQPTTLPATTTTTTTSKTPLYIRAHSVGLEGPMCERDLHCEDPNAVCNYHKCRCREGYYQKQHICRKVCPSSNFECLELGTHGRGPQCVSDIQVCDSVMQCADGSDEFNCPDSGAPPLRNWQQQQPVQANQGSQQLPQQPLAPQPQQPASYPQGYDQSPYGYSEQGMMSPDANVPGQPSDMGSFQTFPEAASNFGQGGNANYEGYNSEPQKPQQFPGSGQLSRLSMQSPPKAYLPQSSSRYDSATPDHYAAKGAQEATSEGSGSPQQPGPISQQLPVQKAVVSQGKPPSLPQQALQNPVSQGGDSQQLYPAQSQHALHNADAKQADLNPQTHQSPESSRPQQLYVHGQQPSKSSAGQRPINQPDTHPHPQAHQPSGSQQLPASTVMGAGQPAQNKAPPSHLQSSLKSDANIHTGSSHSAHAGPSHSQVAGDSRVFVEGGRPSVIHGQQVDSVAHTVPTPKQDTSPKNYPHSHNNAQKAAVSVSGPLPSKSSPKSGTVVNSHAESAKPTKTSVDLMDGQKPSQTGSHSKTHSNTDSAYHPPQAIANPEPVHPHSAYDVRIGEPGASGRKTGNMRQSFLNPTELNNLDAQGPSRFLDGLGNQYNLPQQGYGQQYNQYGRYPNTYSQNLGGRGNSYAGLPDQLYPGVQGQQRVYPQQGYLDFGYPSPQYEFGDFDPAYSESDNYPGSHDVPSYRPDSKLAAYDGPYKGQEVPVKDGKTSHADGGRPEPADQKPDSDTAPTPGNQAPKPEEDLSSLDDDNMSNAHPDSSSVNTDDDNNSGNKKPLDSINDSQQKMSQEEAAKTSTDDSSKKDIKPAKETNPPKDRSFNKNSNTEDLIRKQNDFIAKVKLDLPKEPASMQGPIIALSLGLAFTLILLTFVACRLRNVRRRLRKGRPLHSNEADYLINGMYL